MNPTTTNLGVEATYRRQQIASDFAKANAHRHHPVRRIGRALVALHHRLEVV